MSRTTLWRCEAFLLKLAGKKIVILPYGSDIYRYSRIVDPCLRHALLLSYPAAAKNEPDIEQRVSYWNKHADVVVTGFIIDGTGRWDLLPFSYVTIDTDQWKPRISYSLHDGKSGVVKVVHAPNHRGFKGTEFLIHAVETLQAEGLKVELILLEGVQNEEVRRVLAEEADILAEQFIATGYALSGIEGMASGLPVMSNLGNESYTRLFYRYSYLSECPVLSTTPEILQEHLRILVTKPALREVLGRAGRAYVEKYHSEATAQYMFGAIYEKIWFGKDVDLMNLFHPISSKFNRRKPMVAHPLQENLPSSEKRFKTLPSDIGIKSL
ncbi:MAG: glycosyltransferase [Cyanobacteria bacterium NC_groundwater_1444_Ag_S-0.65um_54_12]|nr:glycosyltransferase [Cyanobacteria bacterium NC_groundwater_1444_Ag_S-0.65um_54_12]